METLNPDFVVWCCVQAVMSQVGVLLFIVHWRLFKIMRNWGAEEPGCDTRYVSMFLTEVDDDALQGDRRVPS